TTSWPRLTKLGRSRETNRRPMRVAYCAGSGRSRPYSWRTAASVSAEAPRPARRAAGSAPGVAKKIRNTSTLMPNSTKTARPALSTLSSLKLLAEHVQREHGDDDGDSGRDRDPGAAIYKSLSVA